MSQQTKALDFHFALEDTPKPTGKTLIIQGTPGDYHSTITDLTPLNFLKTQAAAWQTKDTPSVQHTDEKFDLIIHFATKFASENLSHLGTYAQQLNTNGRWISVVPNLMGASRLKKDISKLFPEVETSSKAKCRIFDTTSTPDNLLARKWASLAKPKTIPDTNLITTPGIFSAEKLDTGSKILAEILKKESWYGSGADLGSAYGYLSQAVLDTPRQKIREILLCELDSRALECAKTNLADHPNAHYRWVDVTQGITHERKLDWIITNPPFHQAQDQSFELGKTFIRQAAALLKPGGNLYLVANIHLPYENLILEHFRSHRLLTEQNGFKVIHARA